MNAAACARALPATTSGSAVGRHGGDVIRGRHALPRARHVPQALLPEHAALLDPVPALAAASVAPLLSADALLQGMAVLADAAADAEQSGFNFDVLKPVADVLEGTLKLIQGQLIQLGVPYSYGWSIIVLTMLVKVALLPVTIKQVQSSLAMQELKPQIDAIKARYGEDKDRVQKETAILYEEAGVDPLAGCLPTLATLPIFWGLYRSLSTVADEGALTEGFYWIPSLSGPTSLAAQRAGSGTAWLFPFVDGVPPIGWEDAAAYLSLPIALIVVQYWSQLVLSPVDPNDESAKQSQWLVQLLPLMLFWFSLNVPSGLALYYVVNTSATIGIQYWLKNLGGTKVEINAPESKVGTARRTGTAKEDVPEGVVVLNAPSRAATGQDAPAASTTLAMNGTAAAEALPQATSVVAIVEGMQPNMRCKRPLGYFRPGARGGESGGAQAGTNGAAGAGA